MKKLAGNPGRRPLNKKEPAPPPGLPKCPEHLDATAKAEWTRMVKELHECGLITVLDRGALAAYCQAWARWIEAEGELKKEGMIVYTEKGFPCQSPWLSIANEAIRQMKSMMTEFGLTPASRSRINVEKPGAAEDSLESFNES